MLDQSLWGSAWARLDALRSNIPGWIKQPEVDEYHAILNALQSASGRDFSPFQISKSEVAPKIVSATRATARRPGTTTYSRDGYCDETLFRRRVEGAWNYANTLNPAKQSEHTRSSPNVITVGNMYGSAIQQGARNSPMQVRFASGDPNLRRLLVDIRNAMQELELAHATRSHITADVGSIEAQLSSPSPKTSVISECLLSVRTIFENMAGNAIAMGLVYEIDKFLGN